MSILDSNKEKEMPQIHFIISLDTETQTWSIDYEGLDRFDDRATVWVPDESAPFDDGEWVDANLDLTPELKASNPQLYRLAEDTQLAYGRLGAMLMMANERSKDWLEEAKTRS